MSRSKENQGFICVNCNEHVVALQNGSYRNHCPYCLHSVHLDIVPGDRASQCFGVLEPIKVKKKNKHFQIIHVCSKCGETRRNKIAENDPVSDLVDTIILYL